MTLSDNYFTKSTDMNEVQKTNRVAYGLAKIRNDYQYIIG